MRPVIVALLTATVLAFRRGGDVDVAAPSRSEALASVLRSRGFTCSGPDVVWVRGEEGTPGAIFGGAEAIVRASVAGEPSDLYRVAARLSPEGSLLETGSAWNLTHTMGVDESRPLLHGTVAAYTTTIDGTVTGVHTLDLAGRAPSAYAEFTRTQRWQTSLTNLQQTGRTAGVVHDAFTLDPLASTVSLAWRDDGLIAVVADERKIVLDPARGEAVVGSGWVRPVPEEKARPGNLVTWSVDRVRAMPWFGDDRMQWVKYIAFTALDLAERLRGKIGPDTSEGDVAKDLGGNNAESKPPAYVDPEIGWPPAPMNTILPGALPGEGKWISLDHDPFLAQAPGLPSPFVSSFIRSDRERKDTRVYVTLWDPRQIALHMEAGTVEPVSATGEGGPGVIPRAPEIMDRVVAGFNGGFQAMHGEYGMQADEVLYLPPKPFAATVIELRDGTTAFGAWPRSAAVPGEVLSFRQNLTALVQDGRFNPWGRAWWGGTPPGWEDNIHTTRSGICITRENFVGYFFGNEISAEALAAGMLAARCSFGLHLDMNPGLVGLELYNVEPTSRFVPLGRPLQRDWEYEGTLSDLPGFNYRARRMVRSMVEINFPQYIHREGRDFFYLTQRPVLPGAVLPKIADAEEPGEGAWQVKGLPQHGFPYAVATAWRRLAPDKVVRVLRVDPREVRPAGSAGTSETTPTVVSLFAPQRSPRGHEVGLWWMGTVFLTGEVPPPAQATLLATGERLDAALRPGDPVDAALGVHDEDGMLEWVELPPSFGAVSLQAVDRLLEQDGCGVRLFLRGAQALLGGTIALDGSVREAPTGLAARLVRGVSPAANLYFTDTPIVGPAVWQPLQSQRVRYFPHPKAAPSIAAAPSPIPAPPTPGP